MSTTRQRYVSSAQWNGQYWSISCAAPPVVSTARSLARCAERQRHALSASLGIPAEQVRMEIRPVLPEAALERLNRSKELRAAAAWANHASAIEVRAAARALVDHGLSLRDIGWLLGVSFQRVHQLINS
ncbi:hypothetical protein [Phytoactinopolyspora mesophila]|uniref:Uncharacterized protein n=1 Tax=Phytoactinopolyspora mesophila TaxID=2650750 RepID=A0A7K3M116_9ACTN|nr:hypothetical protein [Phytoactinopolyspora mesophila]NDL56986.1 hypothetical protein [Phytoactinopolyspora mesophila]